MACNEGNATQRSLGNESSVEPVPPYVFLSHKLRNYFFKKCLRVILIYVALLRSLLRYFVCMKLERRIQHKTLFNGECRLWTAYSVDECPKDVEYVPWREFEYTEENCRDKVFHVLSDDGMVVPVFNVGYIKTGIVLKTPFGHYVLAPMNKGQSVMNVLVENQGQLEDYAGRKHHSSAMTEAVVSQLAAHGMELNEIIKILTLHPFGQKAQKIRKFYKSEECRNMIRDEVRTILNNCGITEEAVVKMLLEAHEVAKEKRDCSNMLRATENLVDMYGLKDKAKETTTQTIEIGNEVEDLQRLENVKERLKLQQKVEKEEA